MQRYIAIARSNLFKVKNLKAFKTELANYDIQLTVHNEPSTNTLWLEAENGNGFPDEFLLYDKETHEEQDLTLIDLIASHLEDQEVVILTEIGHNDTNDLTGNSIAFNNKGETRKVGLYQIYDLANELRPIQNTR